MIFCISFRSPVAAENPANHRDIRFEQARHYSKIKKKKSSPRFKIGQICRVAWDRTVFSRGYGQTFSNELYKVSSIKTNLPIFMYKVKPVSLNDDEPIVKGSFYENELQDVNFEDDYFAIDRIIKTFPKKKTALVSYQDFPESFNSIVPLSQIKTYKELLEA